MSSDRRFRGLVRFRRLLRQIRGSRSVRMASDAYRILLLVSAAILIDLAFPSPSGFPDLPALGEGMVARDDVIASVKFPVYKSEAELTGERADAASSVSPIFNYRPEAVDSATVQMRAFFRDLDQAEAADSASLFRVARNLLEQYRVPASDEQAALLTSKETRERVARAVERAFRDLLRPGVAQGNDLGVARNVGVVVRRDGEDQLVARDSVPTMQQFFARAAEQAPLDAGSGALGLYQNLIIRFSEPSLRLDRVATEAARDQARQAVNLVKYEVLEGERIVAAHERVGPEQLERLRAYRDALGQRGNGEPWGAHLGVILYNLALLLVFGLVLRSFWPEVYESQRSNTLIWIVLLAVAVAAAAVSRAEAAHELIPVAFAALVIASLFDGLLAFIVVFLLVALLGARPPLLGMTALVSISVGGAVAALSGQFMQRRAQTWAVAGVIAGSYALVAICLGLINRQGLGWIVESGLWGIVNGAGSTIVAVGILPLAEAFTKITTDQSLLELADVNRPLLRRLSLEAPGTYAHSINVANIAEAAARAIGANALLVRVGTYYHDIGKVRKPQFFVENQPPGRNPHDKLKPTTSINIIREHVNEGLDMAEEARLPDIVKAFIVEHHGTQRIGFFLEKAKELEPDTEFDPNDFRYLGPKPRSKETAILLLADSVESAARVLQDPTPERISDLVDRIVGFKIDEGQLDEAPLSLGELTTIKQQFVKVLSGMYHHRLDYPAQSQQPAPPPEQPAARGSA